MRILPAVLIASSFSVLPAAAQYLPLMGPNGPLDIPGARPESANRPTSRVLADNPDFACPVSVRCLGAGGEEILIELDPNTPLP